MRYPGILLIKLLIWKKNRIFLPPSKGVKKCAHSKRLKKRKIEVFECTVCGSSQPATDKRTLKHLSLYYIYVPKAHLFYLALWEYCSQRTHKTIMIHNGEVHHRARYSQPKAIVLRCCMCCAK